MQDGAAVRAAFNFRALATVLLGALYGGGLWWALVNGRLDVQSFVSGLGPSFGLALGYWFRDAASPPAQ